MLSVNEANSDTFVDHTIGIQELLRNRGGNYVIEGITQKDHLQMASERSLQF